MMMGRRSAAFMIALLFFCSLFPTVRNTKAPHLVYALVDDMGFNDFYTSSDIAGAWPNVAKLAASQCVSLGNFYTQPICTPSRGAFITGRMPLRLGLQHSVINGCQNYGLPLNETTLADKLSAAGYRAYGVGKWHLGMYNNASTPTHRGFDHFFGYYNGYEDYWQHSVALGAKPSAAPVKDGYLDLHDDGALVRGMEGTYGPEIFRGKVASLIRDHRAQYSSQPLFLYYAMQNVHDPLEAMDEDLSSSACAAIANDDRKLFCGMARSADRAILNLTAELAAAFGSDDSLLVINGDNGGNVHSAGNNCPDESRLCLRGKKATLWEGGIRNNALVCSPTLLPSHLFGSNYTGGLVHLMDIHALFVELGRAAATPAHPIDGVSFWSALTSGSTSPRSEFIINIDPCSGHGACQGVEAGIRSGDWKYLSGVQSDTWYPVPSGRRGKVPHTGWMSTNSTMWLFNITADPNERTNVAAAYPEVVSALQEKIDEATRQAMAPCNIPGGSCNDEDMDGWAAVKSADGWVPWVKG